MKRKLIQAIFAAATNSHITGFLQGRIYRGKLKGVCVPGLNCYSCPGALGSCPIGSLQAISNTGEFSLSFYVLGLLLLFGILFGRLVCGFLCPFGLIQELIHKIPFPKTRRSFPRLKKAKYGILAVFVVLAPMLVKDAYGMGSPQFCKYICPAGTLTAGIPLMAANPALAEGLGWLFGLKAAILVGTVIGCLSIYRFFCKYMCPLGAIYSLFNRYSVYRLRHREAQCIHCGKCARVCRMDVDPSRDAGHGECIRCGDCVRVCPTGALDVGFRVRDEGEGEDEDGCVE